MKERGFSPEKDILQRGDLFFDVRAGSYVALLPGHISCMAWGTLKDVVNVIRAPQSAMEMIGQKHYGTFAISRRKDVEKHYAFGLPDSDADVYKSEPGQLDACLANALRKVIDQLPDCGLAGR
jgi:hypothetical protein